MDGINESPPIGRCSSRWKDVVSGITCRSRASTLDHVLFLRPVRCPTLVFGARTQVVERACKAWAALVRRCQARPPSAGRHNQALTLSRA